MAALPSYIVRILSSLVLIPLVAGVILWGGWALVMLLATCFLLSLYEWNGLAFKITHKIWARGLLVLAGILYLVVPFRDLAMLGFNGLKLGEDGRIAILYLFVLIWSSDTLAYVMGKNIGGPKMTPHISPNKTWSGYAGALLGPALVMPLLFRVFPLEGLNSQAIGLPLLCLMGAVIGMVGQSGDLLISFLKRRAGVKDTGALIPGHGGLLDRIDALLLAVPVFYAYVLMMSEVMGEA